MLAQDIAFQSYALLKIITDYVPSLIGALVVLFAGRFLSRWLHAIVIRAMQRSHVGPTLQPLIAGAVRYAVLAVTLLIVLQQFGIQTASLLALLGAVGLAVGLALQGTLSNVAAGLLLLFLRRFEVGDQIETANVRGQVLGIDLFHTSLRAPDGVAVVVPNSAVLAGPIRNLTRFPERMISGKITVAPDSDPARAAEIIRDAMESETAISKQHARNVRLQALAAGGCEVEFSAWGRHEDLADTRSKLMGELHRRFAAEEIKLA